MFDKLIKLHNIYFNIHFIFTMKNKTLEKIITIK